MVALGSNQIYYYALEEGGGAGLKACVRPLINPCKNCPKRCNNIFAWPIYDKFGVPYKSYWLP